MELLGKIAINNGENSKVSVTFAEFAVFVDDVDHNGMFGRVCSHISKSRTSLFHNNNNKKNNNPIHIVSEEGDYGLLLLQAFDGEGVCGYDKFERGLQRLELDTIVGGGESEGSDFSDVVVRLIRRFDLFGDGFVSVNRFIRMVKLSRHWKKATAEIEHFVECSEEALAAMRRRFSASSNANRNTDFIYAAVKLGIRVCSDVDLLWIVEELLSSELPKGWTKFVSSKEQKTFYVSQNQNNHQLVHPNLRTFKRLVFDDYLRALYVQQNREGGINYNDLLNGLSIAGQSGGNSNNNSNNNSRPSSR